MNESTIPRPWKPADIERGMMSSEGYRAMRCFTGWCQWRDRPCTRESVEEWLMELTGFLGSRGLHARALGVLQVLPTIEPDTDWRWLRDHARQLSAKAGFSSGQAPVQPPAPLKERVLSLAPADWQEPWKSKWLEITGETEEPDDLLGNIIGGWDDGIGKPLWNDKTKQNVETVLGMWFWHCREQRFNSDWPSETAFASFITAANRRNLADFSKLSYANHLHMGFAAMEPDRKEEIRYIRALVQHSTAFAVARTKTEKFWLHPAESFVRARNYFFSILNSGRWTPQNITAMRDAMMIAFLALLPIRLANFANLKTDILQAKFVQFDAGDMKNNYAYEMAIPKQLLQMLEVYVKRVLPYLGDSDRLWLNKHGKAMDGSGCRKKIAAKTEAIIGQRISAHRFRDAFASRISETATHEDMMLEISRYLGHRHEWTTNKHYRDKVQSAVESRELQKLVDDL